MPVPDRPFSTRQNLRPERPLIFDDAPESVRYGLRAVLRGLGYDTATKQRTILCEALRIPEDQGNWSEYPNVHFEVVELLDAKEWPEFFDALERIPGCIGEWRAAEYYEAVNRLLVEEHVGYRFESGSLVRVGTDEFHAAVETARHALAAPKFEEARRQFERGLEFRNDFPPDWPNAIKEAVNSVEAVLQIIYGRHGVALSTIVTGNVSPSVPGGVNDVFRALYRHGSGTVGARHASIGGNDPTAARAELALHIAAALHAYAVSELFAATSDSHET